MQYTAPIPGLALVAAPSSACAALVACLLPMQAITEGMAQSDGKGGLSSFQAVRVLQLAVQLAQPVARRMAQHGRLIQALCIVAHPLALRTDQDDDEGIQVGQRHTMGLNMLLRWCILAPAPASLPG